MGIDDYEQILTIMKKNTENETSFPKHLGAQSRRNKYTWLEVDFPKRKLFSFANASPCSCLKNLWIVATVTFSVPKSERILLGSPGTFGKDKEIKKPLELFNCEK